MKLVACLLLVSSLAFADDDAVTYRVKQGDSIDIVAAEFYGDRTKAVFIESRSSMKSVKTISPVGCVRLTFPEAVTVSVRWL